MRITSLSQFWHLTQRYRVFDLLGQIEYEALLKKRLPSPPFRGEAGFAEPIATVDGLLAESAEEFKNSR